MSLKGENSKGWLGKKGKSFQNNIKNTRSIGLKIFPRNSMGGTSGRGQQWNQVEIEPKPGEESNKLEPR